MQSDPTILLAVQRDVGELGRARVQSLDHTFEADSPGSSFCGYPECGWHADLHVYREET